MQAKLSKSFIIEIEPQPKPFEVVDTEIKGFLLRVQPTGLMTSYFSYRTKTGKRQRIKIGTLSKSHTIAQARDSARIYAGEVRQGVDPHGEKQITKQDGKEIEQNTLSNFVTFQYQPWAIANLKSGQSSVDRVNTSFPKFLNQPLSTVTIQKVERWRTNKLKSGSKPTTVNRIVNSLRAVLTKAVEWEYLLVHPLAKLKALKEDTSPNIRYLSEDEEKRLLEALAQRDQELKSGRSRGNVHRQKRGYDLMTDLQSYTYADRMTPLVMLSLKTGMRRGELFDLEWHNVNLDQKNITVEAHTAKSNKTRHIPLSPTALSTLTAWKEQTLTTVGRVFPSDDGERLDNVRKSWATILDSARIVSFRWHDIRHDFASKLVMKGVPLNTVRELCGHSKIDTTLRYAHLAPGHKADAIDLLG